MADVVLERAAEAGADLDAAIATVREETRETEAAGD
jgi:sirohydrochlorin cobaltochelatase